MVQSQNTSVPNTQAIPCLWLNNHDVYHEFLRTQVVDLRFSFAYTIFRILNIGEL